LGETVKIQHRQQQAFQFLQLFLLRFRYGEGLAHEVQHIEVVPAEYGIRKIEVKRNDQVFRVRRRVVYVEGVEGYQLPFVEEHFLRSGGDGDGPVQTVEDLQKARMVMRCFPGHRVYGYPCRCVRDRIGFDVSFHDILLFCSDAFSKTILFST